MSIEKILPDQVGAIGPQFVEDDIVLTYPIKFDGKLIGNIFIRSKY